jgi:serine/threonine protein kinase
MRDTFYDGVILDGRFQTISPMNSGSFGMVFMAKDLLTNEFVAVKCTTKKSASGYSEQLYDEKSEELACHARLGDHPNIVNLIHSFETEAHVYLVLEFCARGDLYEAIRTGCGPLETEHVRGLMLQLVDAVSHVHSKGMYHRDIKPENIFLTEDGTLKLGDFGLATHENWSYELNCGSERYESPEQYDHEGSGYSPAQADIWAIGICLLNILFSRNPFTKPTMKDLIFMDFVKDDQSLFDVFPGMSQDTFEVIKQCMSMDPKKRSLAGAREALVRAVNFTTSDENFDDFHNLARPVVVSANREPLRTPSIQSPQIDNGSFPWAKALHASPPQAMRQLSMIPDTESYSEDLFPSSEESNKDWFSVHTPSMASVLNSSLGASMKSMAIRRPAKKAFPPRADLTPISGSLPIAMSKAKPVPSLSSVFGRKHEMVSKSWSDMWEEDVEEEAHESELKERQANNARTWSHESNTITLEDPTIRREGLSEPKSLSFVNIKSLNTEVAQAGKDDIDGDIMNDGFFFQDTTQTRHHSPPRYSPPSKRTTFDKWAALGDRRRRFTNTSNTEKSPDVWRGRRQNQNQNQNQQYAGFAGFGHGVWDIKVNNGGRTGCPWGRDRDQLGGKDKVHNDLGDLEWVGGWHDSPDLQL